MGVKLVLLTVIATLVTLATPQRIWSIAVGHDFFRRDYFDDARYLQGFEFRLVDLVCTSGNIDCRIVRDDYKNCWENHKFEHHPSGGKGLLGGWYDACCAWTITVERSHVFSFSLPYLKPKLSYFFVRKGKKDQFDPLDLRAKRIAIFGWGHDERCLARQTSINGHILRPEQINYYQQTTEIIRDLKNNKVDATFGPKDFWTEDKIHELDIFEEMEIRCFLGGFALMTRKDSDFNTHWNAGFMKLREGSKFNELCRKGQDGDGHKGPVDCVI